MHCEDCTSEVSAEADALRQGRTTGFPTEMVYRLGLGANAGLGWCGGGGLRGEGASDGQSADRACGVAACATEDGADAVAAGGVRGGPGEGLLAQTNDPGAATGSMGLNWHPPPRRVCPPSRPAGLATPWPRP